METLDYDILKPEMIRQNNPPNEVIPMQQTVLDIILKDRLVKEIILEVES